MRITSKGQVTIPVAFREKLGLLPDTEVTFALEGNAVKIYRAGPRAGSPRGRKVVAGLRGRSRVKMSTDEILALTRRG